MVVGCEGAEQAFQARPDLLWTADKVLPSLQQELINAYRVLCGIHQQARVGDQDAIFDSIFDLASILEHLAGSLYNHQLSAVDRVLKTKLSSTEST